MKRPVLEFDGVLIEKRELTAKANGNVFARQFTVETIGACIEVRVSEEDFAAFAEEDEIEVTAKLTKGYKGDLEVHGIRIAKLASSPSASSGQSPKGAAKAATLGAA